MRFVVGQRVRVKDDCPSEHAGWNGTVSYFNGSTYSVWVDFSDGESVPYKEDELGSVNATVIEGVIAYDGADVTMMANGTGEWFDPFAGCSRNKHYRVTIEEV